MLVVVSTAIFVAGGSLLTGQLVLRICGAEAWHWAAVPVGLSLLMLVAACSIHLPGRSDVTAVAVAALVIAGAVVMIRDASQRPPVRDLLAAGPVAFLVLLPFLAAGTPGNLGVSIDNDMASHLELAEAYRDASTSVLLGSSWYPTGPHGLAACLSSLFGERLDIAFAGLSMALPVLLGWTALGAVRDAPWLGRVAACTAIGAPFLISAAYGEGAFKEVGQAILIMGMLVYLLRPPAGLSLLLFVPIAVMLAGTLEVYSLFGLAWPAAILGVSLLVQAINAARLDSLRGVIGKARQRVVPLLIGAAALVLLLAPVIGRLREAFTTTIGAGGAAGSATGIPQTNLGNLVSRLPFWEAFGIWNNPDFRLPGYSPNVELWTAFAAALVGVGVVWSLRRRDLLLLAAAVISIAIWTYSDKHESPYLAAKALVLLSPLLMLLAIRPLVERDSGLMRSFSPAWRYAAPALAVLFVLAIVHGDWKVLRFSHVGPQAHSNELIAIRPMLGRKPTLFLGNDDFARWELAGVPVGGYNPRYPTGSLRPEKQWQYGQPFDFDSVDAATLNNFRWIITTRDAEGSAPPENVRPVRRTRSFILWRRTGPVRPRGILVEGPNPATQLNCATPEGRQISRQKGVAAIRPASVVVPVAGVLPGQEGTVTLPLSQGAWDLTTQYTSPLPMGVTGGGIRMTLPGNLDRPGPRWPIGRITVAKGAPHVPLRLYAHKTFFTPNSSSAQPVSITATPVLGRQIVPLRRACGQLVDWYRVAPKPAS